MPTSLRGVCRIELEPQRDERGFFARTFCANEFAAAGLNPAVVQGNVTVSPRRGTLRGLHFQRPPHAEAKLIRCVQGAIYDVVVDIRRDSATFGRWEAFELTAENFLSLYVPEGFAHGFQTLAANTQVLYNMSEFYYAECAAGIRWNDPALAITWPIRDPVISAKDAAWPALDAAL
ncbi:MAG TPA: dTDP-4-dehydrorhamnose 3,5-epimerase [Pseudolabrys sp.]